MKQILQNLGSGETLLAEVPCPKKTRGSLLVETSKSLVSLGTEKMLIDFGKAGLIAKARQQPDKVKQVLQKIKTDGLWTTLDAVRAKLDLPIALGYCNAGRVVDADSDGRFSVGDRVASNGPHAEMVSVPTNLAALVPDSVSDEEAAFTVVGAIGLQGIRLLQPTLGERIVVSGLGLIGLLAVQMLRANGCEVLGIDFDPKKTALAAQFGAATVELSQGQDPVAIADAWTRGQGVDGVLITASTKSDELIHQAATMCRKRGRIVLVGVVGLNLRRSDFYEKELTFQVSCSYGPGRYDPEYEKKGLDYPIGHVRWTEQRNFEAVLGLLASKRIDVAPLISHRFAFDDALSAYEVVGQGAALGVLLDYAASTSSIEQKKLTSIRVLTKNTKTTGLSVAFLGAGGFATRMLIPALAKHSVHKQAIVSNGGVTAVFIATPHHTHASLVCESLDHGKHVFVEKPLALTLDELTLVEQATSRNPEQCLMVGFNRRFSPHILQLREWLKSAPGSKSVIMTINAGEIPAEHWTQDPAVGGGRIIGEACHFIDLARFLVGHSISKFHADYLGGASGRLRDSASLHLQFLDGSIATIHYLANGHKAFPKERIEVFAGGDVVVCDNFRSSSSMKLGKRFKTRAQDKGHQAEVSSFIECISNGGAWPIPLDELIEVSRVTLELANR
jgi:predicted dehydrogenase/threonine dehydrogenase-like Zn-dependent dehydrogenase